MIRHYRFPGDDPEAMGGTAIRVIGDEVLLEVGDNPADVEGPMWAAGGWALLDAAPDSTVLRQRITRNVRSAIDALSKTKRLADYAGLIANLKPADTKSRE